MSTKILVAGLIPYDSGKTWFTLSSALYTRSLGYSVRVFKPVAGHNLWYSPRTIRESVRHRALVGNDILLYHKHGLVEDMVLSNPVAIATIPLDPVNYPGALGRYMTEMEQIYSTMALSRLTRCESKESIHYYFPENMLKTTSYLKRVIEKIASELNARDYRVEDFLGLIETSAIEEDLETCFNNIAGNTDVLFIESFNDAIAPYIGLLDHIDYLIVVSPGRAFLYDDIHTIKGILKEYTKNLGVEGLRARWIVEKIEPVFSVETTFLVRPNTARPHRLIISQIISK